LSPFCHSGSSPICPLQSSQWDLSKQESGQVSPLFENLSVAPATMRIKATVPCVTQPCLLHLPRPYPWPQSSTHLALAHFCLRVFTLLFLLPASLFPNLFFHAHHSSFSGISSERWPLITYPKCSLPTIHCLISHCNSYLFYLLHQYLSVSYCLVYVSFSASSCYNRRTLRAGFLSICFLILIPTSQKLGHKGAYYIDLGNNGSSSVVAD
jgi:hypothetical protein